MRHARQLSFDDDEARAFGSASWDFPASSSARDLHPYPARFIAEIPRQALELLAVDGPVIDPFCGSGTTLAAARQRGLPATGIDLNPIAVRSAECGHSGGRAERANGTTHARSVFEAALAGGDRTGLGELIPRIDHWFEPDAQAAIAGAVAYLKTVEPDWRDRIAVALSSCIVRLSRQESDTRYAAVHKGVDREHAATELSRSVIRVCDWLAHNTVDTPESDVDVWCRDARDLSHLPRDHFAAAIFSPPYPNAYEYWLYHKYRMYWLGFDPVAVRTAELGARPHYCKPNGLTEDDFADQMSELLRPRGAPPARRASRNRRWRLRDRGAHDRQWAADDIRRDAPRLHPGGAHAAINPRRQEFLQSSPHPRAEARARLAPAAPQESSASNERVLARDAVGPGEGRSAARSRA